VSRTRRLDDVLDDKVMTRLAWSACLLAWVLSSAMVRAQTAPGAGPPAAQTDAARDHLARETPRGTVRGFLNAARNGNDAAAAQYLNVRTSDDQAATLAHKLFVVLDTRLSAQLTQLSTDPKGSRADPLKPDLELVGTVTSRAGDVDITLERVKQEQSREIWLFSRQTLDDVPGIYEEISLGSLDTRVPRFLTRIRVAGARLLDWLTVLLGLPLLYLLTVLLNRLLSPLIDTLWRRLRRRQGRPPQDILPTPIRLLFLAIAIRWLAGSGVQLPLLARQFWLIAAMVLNVAAVAWLLIRLNAWGERVVRRRVRGLNVAAAVSLIRLGRRTLDLLVLFAASLVILRNLGVNLTPALAGLGVGGIAVALAAQKTLENVIAGASLIFDRAVNDGDFLKVGDTLGEVEHVGLRSTRIRTLDRTVVSVPNSQIANMSLETLSARDTFWFHPVVGLRYETTPEQLREVIEGIRRLLADHPLVEPTSIRVRFIRLGSFSLDVDVFAYLRARDWNHFLEIQEQLLFSVMNIVREAGTEVAFPSQTLYMRGTQSAVSEFASPK
jgi:MscS family membrane protein